jgi:hypothetical protein
MISFFSALGKLKPASFKRGAAVILIGTAVLGAACFFGLHPNPSDLPRVSMTAKPSLAGNQTLLLSYDASDNVGIKEIALRVTPRDLMPGANDAVIEIPLPAPAAKHISRTDLEDLTKRPWAAQKVTLQIVAINEAGKRSLTGAVDFTLPERRFSHPVARVLIEERKKLMQHPDDDVLREEAANVMASIAHEPSSYRGDPVVLMALRSGAVRLVLGHDREAAISAGDLLWHAAARIEDGNPASSPRAMRDTRQERMG